MASALYNLSEYDSNNIPDGSKFHIHLVVSEWNQDITFSLAEGAMKTLVDKGVNQKNIKLSRVPGSYELIYGCLLYTSPSPRDGLLSRMPSSA